MRRSFPVTLLFRYRPPYENLPEPSVAFRSLDPAPSAAVVAPVPVRRPRMSTLLLLTSALQPSAEVLPGLALLGHQVKILPAEGSALLEAPESDLVLVDGRQDLAGSRDLCRLIRTTGTDVPVILVVTEGGLAVVSHDWGMDDVVLHTCGPAELEARIRLAIGRLAAAREAADPDAHVIRSGEVVVDDATYTAKVGGRALDLTFKEFELLKFLAQHPGRVFSRQQLLQEVWGYDYFGGTRTVDVHVRRLRAKLGPENETLIGTVRNVGYRFVLPAREGKDDADAQEDALGSGRALPGR
jgi:DNA-binding response OmpR family regulator